MESATAITQSMHNITTTKLTALSKKHQAYEAEKQGVLKAVASKSNPADKLRVLLDAFKAKKLVAPENISTANVQRFLNQSRSDPSISPKSLEEWRLVMTQALDVPSRRYEHASLFGRLVMEWLGNLKDTPDSTSSDTGDPFEHIGRKEMHDQRKEWESIVFASESKVSAENIYIYLDKLFCSTTKSKKVLESPLEQMRGSMKHFCLEQLDTDSLKQSITGVLVTDLLSEAKRKALTDFKNSPLILQEMADVLNMQIDALDSWSWSSEPVPVEVRRALNGKYRVYMDEEILQALLIHYIGMRLGLHLKDVFTTFFYSGAWKQTSRKPLDRQARGRRQDYGLEVGEPSTVRNERRDNYRDNYFMVQLPSSLSNHTDEYNDGDTDHSITKSPMNTKQSLLHLISTETLINTRLHGNFAILQSDFRWFGPSLPHTTILAVLRFFGTTTYWLTFIEKFLKAPLRFVQDGPNAPVQIRKCGVPIQHKLADALGEAVLFCLDFAVNKETGYNLYRMHDDLWFWGSSQDTVAAWGIIKQFADVMGLTLNESKTGSIEIGKAPSPSKPLPSGPISWGFLKMKPTGQWALDNEQVDAHILELRTQLSACKSMFSWIQAWNLYMARFVSNNFGEPANCLGRPHVDMAVTALEKIQRSLFACDELAGDNVIEHLRHKLLDGFGVTNVPDGFFYFPIELGGLGLKNPFIPLFLVHRVSEKNPVDLIEETFELEERAYELAKKHYENGTSRSRFHLTSTSVDSFISFEEYVAYIEETSSYLQNAYLKLLAFPDEDMVDLTNDSKWERAPADVRAQFNSSYDRWVMQLYGSEIAAQYGGMALGDKGLLPIGLLSMLRSEKVRWQG